MRADSTLLNFNAANKSAWNDAIAMLERALTIDPKFEPAMAGLANALQGCVAGDWSSDPASDLERAQKTADAALAIRPYDEWAHMAKAWGFERKQEYRSAIADAAIGAQQYQRHCICRFLGDVPRPQRGWRCRRGALAPSEP
jgi:tetratricopeptide (TPR) repeat protein